MSIMSEPNCEQQHARNGLFIYKIRDPYRSFPTARKEIDGISESECNKLAKECDILKSLNHPCICPFLSYHTYQDSEGKHHFAMEMAYFDSSLCEELERKREENAPFSESEVEHLLWDIASALAYAQRRGVTHRDVKPSNIMRSPGTRFHLIDFGEGKVIMEVRDGLNTIVGTVQYASPELRPKLVEKRFQGVTLAAEYNPFVSDVYSLGVTALEMLCLVFETAAPNGFAAALSRLDLSPELKSVFLQMMEVRPEKRPNCIKLKTILRRTFRYKYETEIATIVTELNMSRTSLPRIKELLTAVFAFPVDICADALEKCIKCGAHFSYISEEEWRLAVLNEFQMSTSNICSPECYQQLTEIRQSVIRHTCARCGNSELGAEWCFFHCKVHKCCQRCMNKRTGRFFDSWKVCPVCKYQSVHSVPFRPGLVAVTFVNFEEFVFVCEEGAVVSTKNAEVSRMLPSPVWSPDSPKECHCCGVSVHAFQLWFLLVCGSDINYICSQECLTCYLPAETDPKRATFKCPTCQKDIRKTQIAALGQFEKINSWVDARAGDCHMCLQAVMKIQLRCGHHYCKACARSCKEKYRELALHCVRCGYHIEGKEWAYLDESEDS